MRRVMLWLGTLLTLVGVLAIYTPVLDSLGWFLEGLLAFVVGVPLLALSLLTLKRWWALLALVGACVYALSLMLPHPGRHGFAEQACEEWLVREASPAVRETISAEPDAPWLHEVDVTRSYLPAGWACTYHPPGGAPVALRPSWTGTAIAAACLVGAGRGAYASRARSRRR